MRLASLKNTRLAVSPSENVEPRLFTLSEAEGQPGILRFFFILVLRRRCGFCSAGLQPGIFDFTFRAGSVQARTVLCALLLIPVFGLCFAPSARAEYVVLKSGQRLSVTGYQLVGNTYKLTLRGGSAELPATEVVAIEPEEVFWSEKKPALDGIPYSEFITNAAQAHGVDADLIVSVITAESKFNPKAVSRKNARGLMQLLPETATRLGVKNTFDPRENIEAGTKYLRELLDRYHDDLALTLAAYNAGPQRVAQYKTIPPYRETISYIRRVQKTYAARKSPAQNSSNEKRSSSGPANSSALNIPAPNSSGKHTSAQQSKSGG
ncbi:MAG: lytic transglycosylase domain-containing protein [Acidobacteria bacterium]|nr:lytic transglycosylase domain-containing protein [Acidobacteriota bacterium]MBS1866530.1 lytic transglycosylase domain-containing protein [Acidobacteriota bacterium]